MGDPPKTFRAWCFPCKQEREIPNPKLKVINGVKGPRFQMQGKCPACGSVVNKFVKQSEVGIPVPSAREIMAPTKPQEALHAESKPATPEKVWLGTCRKCWAEREFTAEIVLTRFDGKKTLRGRCGTCNFPQVVIGVREKPSEESAHASQG